ncbi:MAG: hypothetical protein Q8Q31_03880 [Nanoarchaeota archaeon]|nr:hypothetical protein [Nanoarchaeota archaeon]
MKNHRLRSTTKEDEKDRVFAELSVASHRKRRNREFYVNLLLSLTMVVASLQAFIVMGRRVISSALSYLNH